MHNAHTHIYTHTRTHMHTRAGYTASGEVLNCSAFDVGLHAAVELNADKLFFMCVRGCATQGGMGWGAEGCDV
jgi:hypothetical protein